MGKIKILLTNDNFFVKIKFGKGKPMRLTLYMYESRPYFQITGRFYFVRTMTINNMIARTNATSFFMATPPYT